MCKLSPTLPTVVAHLDPEFAICVPYKHEARLHNQVIAASFTDEAQMQRVGSVMRIFVVNIPPFLVTPPLFDAILSSTGLAYGRPIKADGVLVTSTRWPKWADSLGNEWLTLIGPSEGLGHRVIVVIDEGENLRLQLLNG
jgi:hypothetical protein